MTNVLKLKSLMFLPLLALMSTSAYAQAQTIDPRDVMNKVSQLEKQINTMSRAVYGDEKVIKQKVDAEDVSTSALAGFDERLSGIENQNKEIINNFEKVNHDISVLQEELGKLKIDIEQRFQQGGATASSSGQSGEYLPDTGGEGASHGSGNAETLYDSAFAAVKATNYVKAETDFKTFIDQYPDNSLVPNALYWLGETYYVRGDFKNAAKSFAKGFQKYPESSKAMDSLLKLGLSLSALGKNDDACLALGQLKQQSKNPDGPITKKANEEFKKLNCK